MHQELEQKLFFSYPKLYIDKDQPDNISLMCYGFECDDGWFDIINDLSYSLEKLINEKQINVRAFQVKQKFGGLRFYTHHDDVSSEDMAIVYTFIKKAENLAYKTCEMCGKPGVVRKGSWVTTLCDEHAEK